MNKLALIAFTAAALSLSACATSHSGSGSNENLASYGSEDASISTIAGINATVIVDGLNNPSSIAFSENGRLAICDAGDGNMSGRVHLVDTKGIEIIEDFPTEYWKGNAYKVGPLSAIWRDDHNLLVTNAGLSDGEETILAIDDMGNGSASNAAAYRTDDDPGEGNLSGMVLNSKGDTAYVCGQGSDSHTWVLTYDVERKELARAFSADKHGIVTDSPMQCRLISDDKLLVLYSGKGGEADGSIVLWNTRTGLPEQVWSLPGLIDPMGMDFIPGSKDQLYVVANNWSLNEVNQGALAKVSLGSDMNASVEVVEGVNLMGPVACSVAPDGSLYVAELGTAFDQSKGRVISLAGLNAKQ